MIHPPLCLPAPPSLTHTNAPAFMHLLTLLPFGAPQADVCDAGIHDEGSQVPARGAGCTPPGFPVLPESHGGTGGQHLPRPGTEITTHTHKDVCSWGGRWGSSCAHTHSTQIWFNKYTNLCGWIIYINDFFALRCQTFDGSSI